MSLRRVVSAVLFLLFASRAYGQQTADGGAIERPAGSFANSALTNAAGDDRVIGKDGNGSAAKGMQVVTGLPPKQQIEYQIKLFEKAVHDAETGHMSDEGVARIYMRIGLWYEDLGLWRASEDDLERSVLLFRRASNSKGDLATAISNLGSLHVAMGKLRDAEKEEIEALRMRQEMKDPLQIARSESDLSALYLAQHKFAQAKDLAERSLKEFMTNEKSDTIDRTFSRYAFSLALCATHSCPLAIPVLKEAVDDATATMQPGDFPIGYGEFFLGYAYWKSGDSADAAQHMSHGTTLMKEQLGWGHPTYLNALAKYAQFLRENRRSEEAKVVQGEINRAEVVIDIRSLKTQTSAFGFAELR